YAPRLTKEQGRIRWSEPAFVIERKVRAFTPWPSAYTMLGGRTLKILRARLGTPGRTSGGAPQTAGGGPFAAGRGPFAAGGGPFVAAGGSPPGSAARDASGAAPGTIVALGEAIGVATGDGTLELLVVQAEGKRGLPARAFVAGARLEPGSRFDV